MLFLKRVFMIDKLKKYLNYIDIQIDYFSLQNIISYWNYLLNQNKIINLISRNIVDNDINLISHIVDSLSALKFSWPSTLKLLDYGSGGGLPGIPLKLANPNWIVTLTEARSKKGKFLINLAEVLSLLDYSVINDKIEPNYKYINFKNSFDLVTARAVSSLDCLIQKAGYFVKSKGYFLAYKGPNCDDELLSSKSVLKKCGFMLEKDLHFTLPILGSHRRLLLFKKY
jgi:16S rRNA (guanine527-N7)-methyltransferase